MRLRIRPAGKGERTRLPTGHTGNETCGSGADANTPSCEAPHFQYQVSGRLAIRMDDGSELIAGPGDVTSLPSGHDAWVLGDEPVVVVDWFGATNYAKSG